MQNTHKQEVIVAFWNQNDVLTICYGEFIQCKISRKNRAIPTKSAVSYKKKRADKNFLKKYLKNLPFYIAKCR